MRTRREESEREKAEAYLVRSRRDEREPNSDENLAVGEFAEKVFSRERAEGFDG